MLSLSCDINEILFAQFFFCGTHITIVICNKASCVLVFYILYYLCLFLAATTCVAVDLPMDSYTTICHMKDLC